MIKLPDDFICFDYQIRRFKNQHDQGWDFLIWQNGKWEFHDNVGIDTVMEYYESAELVSVPVEKTTKKFSLGDTVVFDSSGFNQDFWNELPEKDRVRYYGPIGYNSESPMLFTFICEMSPQDGHCVLVRLEDGKVEIMRHIADFRLVSDDEC